MNSLFGDDSSAMAIPVLFFQKWILGPRSNASTRRKSWWAFYLSAHPLDDYSVVLKYVCNTNLDEFDNNEENLHTKAVSTGGLVTNVREGTTKKAPVCHCLCGGLQRSA